MDQLGVKIILDRNKAVGSISSTEINELLTQDWILIYVKIVIARREVLRTEISDTTSNQSYTNIVKIFKI